MDRPLLIGAEHLDGDIVAAFRQRRPQQRSRRSFVCRRHDLGTTVDQRVAAAGSPVDDEQTAPEVQQEFQIGPVRGTSLQPVEPRGKVEISTVTRAHLGYGGYRCMSQPSSGLERWLEREIRALIAVQGLRIERRMQQLTDRGRTVAKRRHQQPTTDSQSLIAGPDMEVSEIPQPLADSGHSAADNFIAGNGDPSASTIHIQQLT